jgi:hypothetical protein
MRSGKDPWTVMSPEATLSTNVIGGNSGNFLFSYSSHRMLSRSDTEVVSNGLGFTHTKAAQIDEEFDHLVLPLANAFRPDFRKGLDILSTLIEKLTIPVTVLSVGAQASLARGTAELSPLDESVLRFGRAVLERSPSIGVRGDLTAEYLTKLGLRDVEVIGCPSTFFHGPHVRVDKPRDDIDHSARVSFSVTPQVLEMGDVTMRHVRRFANLTYIPQDQSTLQLMLWGNPRGGFDAQAAMPFHPAHPVFRRDLARFFVDPQPWIDYLSTVDFAFGDRIHGNIAAILAGTPALLLAHDSRTLELARYHSIPYVLISDLEPEMDAVDFYRMADFTAFNVGQQARWEKFERYLSTQGLAHAFDEPGQLDRYDARVAAADFPPPVRAISRDPRSADLDRVDWLYREVGRAPRDVARMAKALDAQGERIARLEAQLARVNPLSRPGRTWRQARAAAKRRLDRRQA